MQNNSQNRSGHLSERRRAYKACIPCRKRKARCDLGDRDGPPCIRCRRELRECIFSVERSSLPKKRKLNQRVSGSEHSNGSQASYQQRDNDRHESFATMPSRTPNTTSEYGEGTAISTERHTLLTAEHTFHEPAPDLAQSVMRTVLSNGNDALDLLFQAATESQDETNNATHVELDPQSVPTAVAHNLQSSDMRPAQASPEVLRMWRSSTFVKMGWLSAEEIILFLDMFFNNMNPLSPVLTDFYARHENHSQLVTKEPLLCCTLLMISSRHHTLPGARGGSRGYFVHENFWKYCKHLITKLILGQEKGSKTKMRSIGSIEALLLISEWHPRSLHFPPEIDGWDSDLVSADHDGVESTVCESPPNRWLLDVVEPARRSDRMSWMLLGCALSLAHELNIFDNSPKDSEMSPSEELISIRNNRASKLLYVLVNQLASRLGSTSMFPQNLTRAIHTGGIVEGPWDTHMRAWIELTKLLKSLSEMVFPSKEFTQQLLQSGRYVSLLEHFRPLLEQWRCKYLDGSQLPQLYKDVLFIEFQYVRIYCNSIGMQAACERILSERGTELNPYGSITVTIDAADHEYIQEVISGSCDMLEKVIAIAGKDLLRFSPVRVFLRITTSSVFLLKAISMGVRNTQLCSALNVLHRCVQALRSSVLDDMHLANSYAVLLETHIKRLQKGFLVASKRMGPSLLTTRAPSIDAIDASNVLGAETPTISGTGEDLVADLTQSEGWESFALNLSDLSSENDWLALPFDPSMAPFGPSIGSSFSLGMQNDGLNFIWNLPT